MAPRKLLSVETDIGGTGLLLIADSEGDRCVTTDEDTAVFQLFPTEDGVDAVKTTLDALIVGSITIASGIDDACIDANIVVSEGDVRIDPPEPTP